MAYSQAQYRPRRKKRKGLPTWLLLGALIVGGVVFLTSRNEVTEGAAFEAKVPTQVNAIGDMWWQADYRFRRALEFDHTAQQYTEFTLNHASLVLAGHSLADASDLTIVAQIDDAVEEVPLSITAPNTAQSLITFDGTKFINAKYYLYYGAQKPAAKRVLGTSTKFSSTQLASVGEPESPLLAINTTRKWHLSYRSGTEVVLELGGGVGVVEEGTAFFYVLNGQKKLNPTELQELSFPGTAKLTVEGMGTGENSLYLVAVTGGKTYRSNAVHFSTSKPMLVAWTIDWEGYNVEDRVLNTFTDLSKRYGIPMTQFFNPRIYIDPEIPEYRREQLTSWVKARRDEHGDEIAMHMHMHYDMVRAAGVEPISSPRWGTGTDGYDALTSNYNYEDFSTLLNWALDIFGQKGLGRPLGYRAGGWFADMDILRALNDAGFVYDSSGREAYQFGVKKQDGPWKLTPNTQPYQPSTQDQNSKAPEPRLALWEIPNNGNDSYWFGHDELINRFYTNYTDPGAPLSATKLVTYLSHPDWFDVDLPKLEALFTEISKYSYAEDKGPVVFVTMEQALEEFK